MTKLKEPETMWVNTITTPLAGFHRWNCWGSSMYWACA